MAEGERSKSGLEAKLKVFQGRSDVLPQGSLCVQRAVTMQLWERRKTDLQRQ